ncbi:hypothetical protein [Pseudomarimonas salicorniae]|uniref:Uncharacterized protein n=1 Tax=Pseudomarimonas salicorniae TaxID=2933270 RepID=A0ABT0GEB3_9GAMM|nr:hypothetical protein [Lysobacter sp. CAU 1642]MCK7592894.1 hypothetical protein [Lysobacter sp. CAU 1642]
MKPWLFLPLALCAAGAQAALPEGIAGPWYNPAQSGHGLTLSLADRGSRGVVLWHVYDPDGAPLTLYVDAVVEGRDLVGPAYAPRGMRFGEFDPDDIELPEWGTVRIRFDDCDHATLSWDAIDPDYADGEMPIDRLARIDTLDCVLPPPNTIPSGLYLGSIDPGHSGVPTAALGIVDLEGRLWGYSGELEGQGIRLSDVPGPTFVSAVQPKAYISNPVAPAAGGSISVRLQLLEPNWSSFRGGRSETIGSWAVTASGSQARFPAPALTPLGELVWRTAPESVAKLVQPVNATLLAGTYAYRLRGQLVEFARTLRIDPDGAACLGSGSDCEYRGHVSALEGDAGLLDFRLQQVGDPRLPTYAGRGWIDDSNSGRRLVLVGENGSNGLALVATRMEGAR